MTTNDKPVCYQWRGMAEDGSWGPWHSYENRHARFTRAMLWPSDRPSETRDLYARPQPAAPQVPEGTMRQLLIACINDLDLIEGADKYDRSRLESVGLILRAITSRPECPCGEATCEEPWEPGCGFGRSEEHVQVYTPPAPEQPDSVTVPREVVAAYARSTHIPRHRRICEAALGEVVEDEQPIPAGDVEADAARYRWLRDGNNERQSTFAQELATKHYGIEWDAIIDMARLAARPAQGEPKYTTGHCENHKQPGGCQLHNLHCRYPECDRKPAQGEGEK